MKNRNQTKLIQLLDAFMDNPAINAARHTSESADALACEIESLLTAEGFYSADTGDATFPVLTPELAAEFERLRALEQQARDQRAAAGRGNRGKTRGGEKVRARILRLSAAGKTGVEIAATVGVSAGYVSRVLKNNSI